MSLEELIQVEVVVASRRPTRLQDVAENVSVITAKNIRAMNAHSVNEILQTVVAFNTQFRGGHFGGNGSLQIHASYYEHVLLLLDGVRINDLDAGYPESLGIPVQIIDHIEVVKGPASSTWGSALGGVVNIVTRKTETTRQPMGKIYGSYGKGPSVDYRADVSGTGGNIGYYFYGGYMDSDGLLDDRYFNNKSFYGKVTSDLTSDTSLTLTAGYWYPDLKDFDMPETDLNYTNKIENFLITGNLDVGISKDLVLNLDVHYRVQNWHNQFWTLSTGRSLENRNWDNANWGGNASLIIMREKHTMLFGAEFDRGINDRTWLKAASQPFNWGTETREDWAVYFNDTIKLDKLAIIPGLRYDHLSIVDASTEDLLNPSLGATYTIADDMLVRASLARGFIRPGIGLTVGAYQYAGYPDFKPEDIWSIQTGVEYSPRKKIYLKTDIFYHRQDKTWFWDNDAGLYVNGGVSERSGIEFNSTVQPLENLTADLGFTYIWVEPYNEGGDDTYSLNIRLKYSTQMVGSIILFGRYHWYNDHYAISTASYDDMIWDIHYNRDIYEHEATGSTVNFFLSVRNLFNGAHYYDPLFKNPERWIEAGLRISF